MTVLGKNKRFTNEKFQGIQPLQSIFKYGKQAGYMHFTGMHSCSYCFQKKFGTYVSTPVSHSFCSQGGGS